MADYMLSDTYWPQTNEYWPGADGNDYWPNFGNIVIVVWEEVISFVLNIRPVEQMILKINRTLGTELGIKRSINLDLEL